MQKLLIATKNKGKLKELKEYLSDLPLELLSLEDVGITDDVAEDGDTYEESSKKKALFYAGLSNLPTLADDGGIEIEALGGAPGVKSNRWLGPKGEDKELLENMIKVSKNLPNENRRACFRAVISFVLPKKVITTVEGRIDGIIAKKPLNTLLEGLPYRSFFFLPEVGKYYHTNELTEEEEKLYNHRYNAIQKLKPTIIETLNLK